VLIAVDSYSCSCGGAWLELNGSENKDLGCSQVEVVKEADSPRQNESREGCKKTMKPYVLEEP